MLADPCSSAVQARFSTSIYDISYDVTVGETINFDNFMGPTIILPSNCWSWDGTAQIFEDLSLTILHDSSILTYDSVDDKLIL